MYTVVLKLSAGFSTIPSGCIVITDSCWPELKYIKCGKPRFIFLCANAL